MKTSSDHPPAESSAHVVFSIDDLLIEILRRLPLKSILVSKLVCKHWNSLAFNLGRIEPPAGLLFQFCKQPRYAYIPFSDDDESMGPQFKFVLNFIKDHSDVKILQSCNGLLLCCSEHSAKGRRYYVCNPITNKYSKLPVLNRRGGVSNLKTVRGLNLAFDPSRSPYYKVVCARKLRLCPNSDCMYQFEVYSSDKTAEGIWRVCGEPFAAEVNFQRGVYWNGAIHWISASEAGESIYFNLDDQTAKVMPTPPILDGDDSIRNYYFGESCGHLHYIDACKAVIEFNVYEMKRDYSEWFVKYKVDASGLGNNYLFSIATLVRGWEDEDSFLVLQVGLQQFVRYDIVCKTWETIGTIVGACISFNYPVVCSGAKFAFQYIQSICSV